MKRAVALSLGLAIEFAACSNSPAIPATMMPGVTVTGGTGAVPVTGAAGVTAPATGGTGAVGAAPGTIVGIAGAGGKAPSAVAGTGGTSVTGAAGVGTAGTPSAVAGIGAGGVGATAGTVATAGAGGSVAGSDAPQAGSGGAPVVASGYKPKCLAKGADLALVGDSWVHYDLGEVLAPRLEKRAKADGALPSGSYNDQAIAGTSLANGGLGLIPDQWAPTKTAARLAGTTTKFVVMDGGGNDVLLGNTICLDNGKMRDQDPTCQKTVADALAAGKKLVEQMKAEGVGQVLYYYYPHVPAGGWDVLDYALPMVKAMCDANSDETFQCYFVDTRDAFQGAGNTGVAMKSLILADDIHPNAMGDDILADLVWKTMKDNCMAQTVESGAGCCTP